MMRIQDWVGLVAVLATVAAGALYVGQMSAQIEQLQRRVELIEAVNPVEAITKARDEARDDVRAAGDAFLNFDLGVFENFGWSGGGSDVRMIPANEGFCYLVRFAGQFAGNGEGIDIFERDGFWYLRAYSQINSPGGRLSVGARCWRYPTQNTVPLSE